ncbi:MAG: sulfatase family protein [Verrucomicrobiales bacterium]
MSRLFLLLGTALLTLHSAGAAENRPNIILLFADDLGRYASAYADPEQPSVNDVIQTPVFDEIAREGVLATNAFVSVPSCSPCRAALISGRHFFRNGSCSQLHYKWNGPDESDPWNDIQGYARILEKSGYHIGLTYKDHVKGKRFGPYYQSAGRQFNNFSQFVSRQDDVEKGKEKLFNEVRENFRSFLAARKEGQPFLYHFHPTNTHRKWIEGSGTKLWGLNPDDLKGKLPPFLPDVPVIRQDMVDYLGEAIAFDRACGIIIEELKKTGEYDNTLIVISGDHGVPGFPRAKTNCYDFGSRVLFAARWPEGIKAEQRLEAPISLIDLAPTFLAAGGLPPEEGMNGQNLLPILKEGKHEELRGWALIGREVHVQTARKLQLPYPTRAIRTAEHLYIINFKTERDPNGDSHPENEDDYKDLRERTYASYADIDASPTKAWLVTHRDDPAIQKEWELGFGERPEIEFYDLKNDPHQIHNLANDPAHEATRSALHNQLMAELEANEDPRLNGDQFDYPPYTAEGLPKE